MAEPQNTNNEKNQLVVKLFERYNLPEREQTNGQDHIAIDYVAILKAGLDISKTDPKKGWRGFRNVYDPVQGEGLKKRGNGIPISIQVKDTKVVIQEIEYGENKSRSYYDIGSLFITMPKPTYEMTQEELSKKSGNVGSPFLFGRVYSKEDAVAIQQFKKNFEEELMATGCIKDGWGGNPAADYKMAKEIMPDELKSHNIQKNKMFKEMGREVRLSIKNGHNVLFQPGLERAMTKLVDQTQKNEISPDQFAEYSKSRFNQLIEVYAESLRSEEAKSGVRRFDDASVRKMVIQSVNEFRINHKIGTATSDFPAIDMNDLKVEINRVAPAISAPDQQAGISR